MMGKKVEWLSGEPKQEALEPSKNELIRASDFCAFNLNKIH